MSKAVFIGILKRLCVRRRQTVPSDDDVENVVAMGAAAWIVVVVHKRLRCNSSSMLAEGWAADGFEVVVAFSSYIVTTTTSWMLAVMKCGGKFLFTSH